MKNYLRRLTGRVRSDPADRHLAYILTFVAGAANAGGFLAVKQYTSHMSGIVSSMADSFALGDVKFALSGLAAFASFVAGAAVSANQLPHTTVEELERNSVAPVATGYSRLRWKWT